MLDLVNTYGLIVLKVTEEITSLASQYRSQVIPKEINDSLHIALATCNNISAIVSWNFKHIVNLNTILGIHQVNLSLNKPLIEIISLENIGGAEYGSL